MPSTCRHKVWNLCNPFASAVASFVASCLTLRNKTSELCGWASAILPTAENSQSSSSILPESRLVPVWARSFRLPTLRCDSRTSDERKLSRRQPPKFHQADVQPSRSSIKKMFYQSKVPSSRCSIKPTTPQADVPANRCFANKHILPQLGRLPSTSNVLTLSVSLLIICISFYHAI